MVAVYLDDQARNGAKLSTLRRRLAAINGRLRADSAPPISLRDEPLASVWRGLQRDIGAPPRRARALEVDELRAVVQACDDTLAGRRDRALLLLGFAGAFRRSELIGLHWTADTDGDGYLSVAPEGFRVVLRRSKTNQLGALEEIAICGGAFAATCPVAALEAWRSSLASATGQEPQGPVFRAVDRHGRCAPGALSRNVVRDIIRRAVARQARRAGASDAEIAARLERLSGHSLRAGLVTTAFTAGISAEDVMRQTRHRDIGVLLTYRRHVTAFVGNVSGRVGL